MFKVFRRDHGESQTKPKRRLGLRNGLPDNPLRAPIIQEINGRFLEQLTTFQDDQPFIDLLSDVCKARTKSGKRICVFDITGKDRALLLAIGDLAFEVAGISNKAVRKKLSGQAGFKNRTFKRISAQVSRQLRLLRDQSLIRKLLRLRKYRLTTNGRQISIALPALLGASLTQLMDIEA